MVSYRTAVVLQIGCHIVGNIALGPHHLAPYSGVLDQGIRVADSADLVLYALLCVSFVLLVWHLLAYWQQVPLPPFTVLGNDYCQYSQQETCFCVSHQSVFQLHCLCCSDQSGRLSPDLPWG